MGTKRKSDQKTKKQLDKEQKSDKGKKRKEGILFGAGILLLIAVFAVILWFLSGEGRSPSDTVVFKVGDENVYLDEVNLCMLQNVVDLGIGENALDTTAEDGSSADEYYKKEVLQLIMDYKVEAMIAEKQGIQLSKEEEEAISEDVVKYLGQISGRILNDLGIERDRVMEVYRERYLAYKLEESVTDTVEVEDQRYCTMYMLLFPKVQVDEDGNYLTEEDGQTPLLLSDEEITQRKQQAEEAHQKLKDGADIEELAKEYGIENVSGKQSNMAESFGDDFTQYAKTLKKGEYSPVIDIASCYAIVEMIEEDNKELSEQVMEHYRLDMAEDALKEKKEEWYNELGVEEATFVGNSWDKLSLYDFAKYVEE